MNRHFTLRTFLSIVWFFLFLPSQLLSQTFTTAQNGNWSSASTWVGGVAPASGGNLTAGQTVNINHCITYNLASDLNIYGELRITGDVSKLDTLTFPSGRSVTVKSSGKYKINYGSHYQKIFISPDDPASGTLKNEGGYVEINNAYVEIPQDWTTVGGTRVFRNGCLNTGQNYSNDNGLDTMINVRVIIAHHGSGNFEGKSSNSRIYFSGCKIGVSGTSGSFNLKNGIYNGDIDSISVAPEGGLILAEPGLSGSVNLDWYCVSSSELYENGGLFTGSQTPSATHPVTLTMDCPMAAIIPIPVILGNFSVLKKGNNDALLNWTSYTETGFSHYTIERSTDGIRFEEKGIVFTDAPEHSEKHYSYIDKALVSGVYYYRLKMIDHDGSFNYSAIKVLRISTNTLEDVKLIVFPNPAQYEVRISLPLTWQGEKVKLELYNTNGQLVKNAVINIASQTESVDIRDLSTGIYIVKALTQKGSATHRIIKK